ncbi:MAG TPA: nuclear transport factor 2 family protein [Gemmataceae bacterium]|jgi:beta-aspartyl-peptidase (threonine type)|nr:nuclear transport factor 2 family protein [Gemmataceae bacterium]
MSLIIIRATPGLAALACLSLFLIPNVEADPKDSSDSEKAVRRVLDSQVAAWNKGDLKGFMAGYWKSEKLTFFSGDKIEHGWQATYDRYQKRYQAEGREMGKLAFSDLNIEMLGADTAWVRGRWKLVTSKDAPGGLFTLIFKKFPDGWRIVHDHTSAGQIQNTGE